LHALASVRALVALLFLVAICPQAFAEPSPPPAPAWLVAPREPLPSLRPPSYFERHSARVERNMLFFNSGYTLATMRDRDTLELYGSTPGNNTSTTLGIGVFSAIVVSAAHTPPFLRFAYDRSLHVGPAIFDGGMGAGFGGRL
jgi:hypothetical protein